jgi:ribose transport system substrate-binding protein
MKKLSVICCIALLLTMIVSVSGCSSTKNAGTSSAVVSASSSQKQIKVAIEMYTQNNPYYVALAQSAKTACEKLGWQADVYNGNSAMLTEAANIDTIIAKKYDCIILDPDDTKASIAATNKATAAGIPVITVDNTMGDGANIVTAVESDSLHNGIAVGKFIADPANKYFSATTVINSILLSGVKGIYVGQLRRDGLMAGIIEARTGMSEADAITAANTMEDQLVKTGKASNAAAKFNVLGQGWGAWTSNGGLPAAEDLLVANPNANLCLGENDNMLLGAQKAIANAGKTKKIVIAAAADGQKEAYQQIKEGTNYIATGENNPVKVCQLAVSIAKQILIDKKPLNSIEKVQMTPSNCINPTNVDQFLDPNSLF